MIPLVVLAVGTLVARTVGHLGVDAWDSVPGAVRVGLAAMLCLTASAHFSDRLGRQDLVAMVPRVLPAPALLVAGTGVLELVLAAALLVPGAARAAGLALVLLLLVLFPANVRAAREGIGLAGRPPTPLGRRALLQTVFVAAAALAAAG